MPESEEEAVERMSSAADVAYTAVFDRTGKRVAEEAFAPAQAPMPPAPAIVLGPIR